MTATQSSDWPGHAGGKCIDRNAGTMCATKADKHAWIAVDYGTRAIVERVELINRENCCWSRTRKVDVRISDQLPTTGDQMFSGGSILGHFAGPGTKGQHIIISGQTLLLNHYC